MLSSSCGDEKIFSERRHSFDAETLVSLLSLSAIFSNRIGCVSAVRSFRSSKKPSRVFQRFLSNRSSKNYRVKSVEGRIGMRKNVDLERSSTPPNQTAYGEENIVEASDRNPPLQHSTSMIEVVSPSEVNFSLFVLFNDSNCFFSSDGVRRCARSLQEEVS